MLKKKMLMGLVPVLMMGTQVSSALANAGGESSGGGGGDAVTEMRIDAIRADIAKWLEQGGGEELVLPQGMTYAQYREQMSPLLKRHEVVIGAVTTAEENATQDSELKVLVGKQPKTCRGFFSSKDMRRHILCNVERFKATVESDQYALIHHEYAGLALVEKNDGASSDYSVSSQVTDYLVPQSVLKLAVKKPVLELDEKKAPPALNQTIRDLWEGIKSNKVLLPKSLETKLLARSSGALLGVELSTQLISNSMSSTDGSMDFTGGKVWLSVAFNPSQPGDLAFARLRGYAMNWDMTWNGGTNFVIRGFEGGFVKGLDGKTESRFTGGTAVGVRVSQVYNISPDGHNQLILGGAANGAVTTEAIRTLDLSDDSGSMLIGNLGLRLMKKLMIQGHARLGAFMGGDSSNADNAHFKGTGITLGGSAEHQTTKRIKLYGSVMRLDTSMMEEQQGVDSVTQATGGILVNFW